METGKKTPPKEPQTRKEKKAICLAFYEHLLDVVGAFKDDAENEGNEQVLKLINELIENITVNPETIPTSRVKLIERSVRDEEGERTRGGDPGIHIELVEVKKVDGKEIIVKTIHINSYGGIRRVGEVDARDHSMQTEQHGHAARTNKIVSQNTQVNINVINANGFRTSDLWFVIGTAPNETFQITTLIVNQEGVETQLSGSRSLHPETASYTAKQTREKISKLMDFRDSHSQQNFIPPGLAY